MVPSELSDQATVLAAGRQIWQASKASLVPLPTNAPAIQQPLSHVPPLHTCPVPQLEPAARAVQDVAANEVWQDSHAFVGFTAPLEK